MSFSSIKVYGLNYSDCGYCKQDGVRIGRSCSYGIESDVMMTSDYEKLMLMGWRRSGSYFYKPVMFATCCPAYTIRLNVNTFEASKSQQKVMRKMKKYINQSANISLDVDVERTEMKLSIKTLPSVFTQEKFDLYKKYQMIVHKDSSDEITESGFTRFLVTSPLTDNISHPSKVSSSDLLGNSTQFGTFHQEYRFDNVLVAVGVIDILQSGVSSVYFFHDPDYKSLALGKYSALKEIEFTKELGLEYYYMGYYIHTCPKMNYKGEYSPSELLCPTTLRWYPLRESTTYLEKVKFTPLDPYLHEERMALAELDNKKRSFDNILTESSEISVSNSSDMHNEDDLEKYVTRFENDSEFDIASVKLQIRKNGTVVLVSQLTREGKEYVSELIEDLAEQCGYDILNRFVIQVY